MSGSWGPPLLRGSASFNSELMDAAGGDTVPTPFGELPRLYTPAAPPDIAAQRRQQRWGGGGSSGSSEGLSSHAGSELSGAPTARQTSSQTSNQMRCPPPPLFGDLDSPAVRSLPVAERKLPSCPQKQGGSSSRKPIPPGDDAEESIVPRALGKDLEETDAVAELSFGDMMLCSPPSAPRADDGDGENVPMQNSQPATQPDAACGHAMDEAPQAAAGSPGGGDHGAPPPVRGARHASQALGEGTRRKRHKPSFADDASGGGGAPMRRMGSLGCVGGASKGAGSPGGAPSAEANAPAAGGVSHHLGVPLISRQNTIEETKMLFAANHLVHTSSFCAPAGTADGFRYDDHFHWGRRLGSGSFADVYEVRLRSAPERRYAVKCTKRQFRNKRERAEYLQEVHVANNIKAHPNVVQYYRAWQDEKRFYVQMELCERGTLRHMMTREGASLRAPAGEPRVWEVVQHIARGLAHIHGSNVIHCDLKPDNILISRDGAFKIGDLGLATAAVTWDEQEGDACYLSRDLLDARPSTYADIFSFGIMLFEIKSGEALPGSGDHWDELRSGRVPPPSSCSVPLAKLIRAMMHPEPEQRPSAQETLNAVAAARQAIAMAAADAAMAAAAGR